jgi:hypothetical protein
VTVPDAIDLENSISANRCLPAASSRFIGVVAEEGDLVAHIIAQISNVKVFAVFVAEAGSTLISAAGFPASRMKGADEILGRNFEGEHSTVPKCGAATVIRLLDIDGAGVLAYLAAEPS